MGVLDRIKPKAELVDFHDNDIQVLKSYVEYTTDRKDMRHMIFEMEVRDHNGNPQHFYKAIKLLRIIRIPKSSKEELKFMEMTSQVLSGLYTRGMNWVVLMANMIHPVPLGLLHLYGVQAVADTIEEAQRLADNDFAALQAAIQGTYKTMEFRVLNFDEVEWLREKMFGMKHLSMVRGIPEARKTAAEGSHMTFGGNSSPSAEGTAEDFAAGMAGREYVLMVVASSVAQETLNAWRAQIAKEWTFWSGQHQGTRSISAGISLPFIFASNLGANSGWSHADSVSHGVSHTDTEGFTHTVSHGTSHTTGEGQSIGSSEGVNFGQNVGTSRSFGESASLSHSEGTGTSTTVSDGVTQGYTAGVTKGETDGTTHSTGTSSSSSIGDSVSYSQGISQTHGTGSSSTTTHSNSDGSTSTHGDTSSTSHTQSSGTTLTDGSSDGSTKTHTDGRSQSHADGQSASAGVNTSVNVGGGIPGVITAGGSVGTSVGTGISSTDSSGSTASDANGTTHSDSHSQGRTNSDSVGGSNGSTDSFGQTHSTGMSEASGTTVSDSTGVSSGKSVGTTTSSSTGTTTSDSVSHSTSKSDSFSESFSKSHSVSQGVSTSKSDSVSQGISSSVGSTSGLSQGQNYGINKGLSTSQSDGTTDSVSNAQSKSASDGSSTTTGASSGTTGGVMSGTSASGGVGPSLSFGKSYQWVDQEVTQILQLLEYQSNRLMLALSGQGAFFVDLFIATPDEPTKAAAQALARTAWVNEKAYVTPLEVLDLTREEESHLLYHFSAFSPCNARESFGQMTSYRYSTVLLANEAVAYSHPLRISEGGIFADVEGIPVLAVPSMRPGPIYLGKIVSGERWTPTMGYKTPFDFRLEESEIMHGLWAGESRSGKTEAALRFAAEVANKVTTKDGRRYRILALDPKRDWRRLARFVDPERYRFYSLANLDLNPIAINLCKIPKGVFPQFYCDVLVEVFCRAYGLAERGREILTDALSELYDREGVFCEDWREKSPERSARVSMTALYERVKQIKVDLEDPSKGFGKAGNADREAVGRVLERLKVFSRKYTIECKLFGQATEMGIDDLLGEDDVVTLESYGLESTFRNFVFGLITSGIFQYAQGCPNGFYSEGQFPTIIMIEEANEVLTGQGANGGNQVGLPGTSQFEKILDQAAGLGILIHSITQKPADMPPSVLANSGLVFAGKLSRADDLEAIVLKLGRDPRRQDIELLKWFPRSPIGHLVCRSSRNFDFKQIEPSLVAVDKLDVENPTDDELRAILQDGELRRTMKTP